jgi:hypothetical protein
MLCGVSYSYHAAQAATALTLQLLSWITSDLQ